MVLVDFDRADRGEPGRLRRQPTADAATPVSEPAPAPAFPDPSNSVNLEATPEPVALEPLAPTIPAEEIAPASLPTEEPTDPTSPAAPAA